jgi:hypothetical protein
MKVEFKLHQNATSGVVTFQARRISLSCDDGSEPRETTRVFRFPMDESTQSFERTIYESPGGPGSGEYISNASETIYWIGGRLVEKGHRAKGFILVTHNPEEPADGGGAPECTTGGRVAWRARRVD